MRKSFIEKVLRDVIVDTRKYRYIVSEEFAYLVIKRIPLQYLDTDKAYNTDNYKVVWRSNNGGK